MNIEHRTSNIERRVWMRLLLLGVMLCALSQVSLAGEGARKLDAMPFSITNSGTYVVTENLTAGGAGGIEVLANDVTIDLNGFTLSGNGSLTQGIINQSSASARLTVLNGFLRNAPSEALRLLGKSATLRGLTITGCGRMVEAGPNSVIENCMLNENSVAYNKKAVELGEGARVQNTVFYRNLFNDDGTLVDVGRNALLSRNVIHGSLDLTDTGYITMVEGAGSMTENVISGNEAGLIIRGVRGFEHVRRSVLTDNDARREMFGFVSNQVTELCVAYDNDSTQSVGNWIYAFQSVNLAIHCLASGNSMINTTAGFGFYDVRGAKGCVSYDNHGEGFEDVSADYSVATDNGGAGFAAADSGYVRNCLAAKNWGAGVTASGGINAVEIMDNHVSTNRAYDGIDVGNLGVISERNTTHEERYLTLSGRHGQVFVPTAGSAINTDNSRANFRY